MTDLASVARGAMRLTVEQRRGRDAAGRPIPPGPEADPLLGHYRGMVTDRLRYLLEAFRAHGDVVRMHFLGLPATLLAHPKHVEHVLQRHHRLYTKQTRGYDRLREFLGHGLLTSEGTFWRRQRRIAQPAFHRKRIAGFGATMVRAAEDLCARLETVADTGEDLDVAREMMEVTLRIAGETLLSTDPSDRAQSVGRALDVVLHEAHLRINRPLRAPDWVPTARNRRYRSAAAALNGVVREIIERRRRGTERPDDLLQMLVEARDEETGEAMSDAQLRDEVMTLFLAGHETTANMMTWTLTMLSRAPEHARRVHAEARDVLGDRPATVEDLDRLEHTARVLSESLRLYPPAWIVGRSPREDDEIDGYRIEAGSLVITSPWVTHRHPAFWRDPEGFDPDRWRPERAASMHRTQYFPFGAGPRMCIGAGFARMEGALLLATLARRFRFDLVPGHPVVPEPLVTLRPKHGVRMTVHRRR
ncbi:MAG TPA: cytochrome P450 [Sandaracinaceae bacterium LLY-WYZ-13_1]|nr:cytochrome P450 [Sandaracinaceae bacterium LLY-WYZ-13_1]